MTNKIALACRVAFGVVFALKCLKRYFDGPSFKSNKSLNNSVIVVTGGTSGIGKAVVKEIVRRGGRVILACRDVEKGVLVAKEIVQDLRVNNSNITTASIIILRLDLSNLISVASFSEYLEDYEIKEIDALINSAGVFYLPPTTNAFHFDETFCINFIGPAVLTNLLVNKNYFKPGARIINLTSQAYLFPNFREFFSIYKNQNSDDRLKLYGTSKLAFLLYSLHLANKVAEKKIGVHNVDPGNVDTPIYRNFPVLRPGFRRKLLMPLICLMFKSPLQGAQGVLYALLSDDLADKTGTFIVNCQLETPKLCHLHSPEYSLIRIKDDLYDFVKNIQKQS